MNFIDTAFELIDLRSFSNLWFWLALAATWSITSYRAVGVPYDLTRRAWRGDGEALADLYAIGSANARRLCQIADLSGLWLLGLLCFAVTLLLLLAFLYWIEFAQALLFLLVPLSAVAWLNLRTARRFLATDAEDLPGLLMRHRRAVQAMGVVSIFFTAMWGMWINLNASVL